MKKHKTKRPTAIPPKIAPKALAPTIKYDMPPTNGTSTAGNGI